MFEHFFECFDFLSQLPDDPGVRVFVDDGVIDDPFRPIGVSQRAERFLVVVGCRRDGRDHHGFAVTSQVVLKYGTRL